MWTHGTSVQVQENGWGALREGKHTTVTPGNGPSKGWVHFAIPTPVVVDGAPLKARTALVRFRLGPQTSIINFQVWNANQYPAIYDQGGSYTNPIEVTLTNQPDLIGGIGISFRVDFAGAGAWIELFGAGIRFS